MNRRGFFATLAALPWAVSAGATPSPRLEAPVDRDPLLLQESPLAGFQYHAGRRVWRSLRVGQPLGLRREPDNPFDPRAVAVYWQGHKLGYLPRRENEAVAQLLDRRVVLLAHIVRLRRSQDPWQCIRLAVRLPRYVTGEGAR